MSVHSSCLPTSRCRRWSLDAVVDLAQQHRATTLQMFLDGLVADAEALGNLAALQAVLIVQCDRLALRLGQAMHAGAQCVEPLFERVAGDERPAIEANLD